VEEERQNKRKCKAGSKRSYAIFIEAEKERLLTGGGGYRKQTWPPGKFWKGSSKRNWILLGHRGRNRGPSNERGRNEEGNQGGQEGGLKRV